MNGVIGQVTPYVLSTDPARTGRFDRVMTRLYCTLLFLLFASVAWTLLGLGHFP